MHKASIQRPWKIFSHGPSNGRSRGHPSFHCPKEDKPGVQLTLVACASLLKRVRRMLNKCFDQLICPSFQLLCNSDCVWKDVAQCCVESSGACRLVQYL